MSGWGIALLVIVVLAVLAITAGVLYRLFGVQHWVICLSSDEEKAALTRHEKGHGFLVTSDSSELTLDSGGKLPRYDALHTKPSLGDLEPSSSKQQQEEEQQQPPHQDDSARSSPVSVGTSSIEPGWCRDMYTNLPSKCPFCGDCTASISIPSPTSPAKGVDRTFWRSTPGYSASDLDLGQGIRRAESCDSVASDSSVLDMQPDMPRIGQIEFALEYDREVSELIVSIFQCRDLTPNPYTGSLDTFVKGMLLPGDGEMFQTKTIKNSTDPVFKERFLFAVDPEHLQGKSLQLQVFAVDKYARQKVIGEADVRVGDIDLNIPIKMWFNLRDIDEKPTEHGDILFSLSYLPTAERLTVVVVKARSLRWRNGKDSGDPFVKVYLLQNGKKISKKKTSVKKGEKNPIFNEAMIFSVPSTALPTVQLRITVAEFQSENKTPSLGHVIVGANTSGTAATHWSQMMTSLRKPVAMWHFLRK